MMLWPHQSASIAECGRELRSGKRRGIIVLPTGAGKTVCALSMIQSIVATGKRALFLAHRDELWKQAYRVLRKAKLHVGAIASKAHMDMIDRSALVQVASAKTLIARKLYPEADFVFLDECRHYCGSAETFVELVGQYPKARIIGLDATPERGRGEALSEFEFLVQVTSIRELTLSGHLVACEVVRPDRYLRSSGEAGNKLAQDPVEAYLEHMAGHQAFLFGASVAECRQYAAALCEKGVAARCLHAQTPDDEREAIIDGFRHGRIAVLTNVQILTEGFDAPEATGCILASHCGTAGQFLQKIGRVLRSAPGKKQAILVDLPGSSHLWGMPEDERIWKLDGKACSVRDRSCSSCKRPIEEYPCPACGFSPETEGFSGLETEIVNAPMQKFARKIAEGPEQRQETLERWLRAAALENRHSGTVSHKFKAVYQVDVPFEWYKEALRKLTHDDDDRISEWARAQFGRWHAKRRARAS